MSLRARDTWQARNINHPVGTEAFVVIIGEDGPALAGVWDIKQTYNNMDSDAGIPTCRRWVQSQRSTPIPRQVISLPCCWNKTHLPAGAGTFDVPEGLRCGSALITRVAQYKVPATTGRT